MDYDDNDFQGENLHLAGEGSSTVSPVLRPYALPKFDFDDSLHGHLRFDSLVENEVFLGITSQEDNQWIEEYSRGSSGIDFSSSVAESRRNNVWSEATSSESVAMLLKSVGQEEMVVGETKNEELDAGGEPGNLTKIMDPNLKQDDGKDHIYTKRTVVPNEPQEKISGFNVSSDCEQSLVRSAPQHQEAQISGGELDSVVQGEKYSFPVAEEKVDNICDDLNQKEAQNSANELFKNHMQDLSTSKEESGNEGCPQNVDASIEEAKDLENRQVTEVGIELANLSNAFSTREVKHSNRETSTIFETSTCSVEKLSDVTNVESVDKLSFEVSIPVSSEMTSLLSTRNCNSQIAEGCDPGECSAEPSQGSKLAAAASPNCAEASQELYDSMHGGSLANSPNVGYVKAIEDENRKSEVLGSDICIEYVSNLSKKVSDSESEHNIMSKENRMDNPTGSGTTVETSTHSMQKLSDASNAEYVDKASVEVSVPVNEESTNLLPTGNCDLQMAGGNEPGVLCAIEPSQGNKCAGAASPICSEANRDRYDSIHEESLASPNAGYSKLQVIEDSNTKSEILGSPKSKVSSPSLMSHVRSLSVEETENSIGRDDQQAMSDAFVVSSGNNLSEMGVGSNIDNVGTSLITSCSSIELLAGNISKEDFLASNNTPKVHIGDGNDEDKNLPAKISSSVQVHDEIQSSEPSAICINHDGTFNEIGDARLPSDCSDMDVEVAGAPDNQNSIESSLSAEGYKEFVSMGQGSESDMIIQTEPVSAVKSNQVSSPDTPHGVYLPPGSVLTTDIVTNDQPKSPIFGVSLVHHDNEEQAEVGCLGEGSSQNEALQVESTVDCSSESPSVDKEGASPDPGEVNEVAGHCTPPVENINGTTIEQTQVADPGGQECPTTLVTSLPPRGLSAKVDDNVDADALLDPKESITGHHRVAPQNLAVNMSDEQQASIDVAHTSECDANHTGQDGGSSAPLYTSSVKLSQSTKDTHEVAKGMMYEHVPLPTVIKELEGKVQLVSSNNDTKGDESFTFEVSASAGLGQTGKGQQSFPVMQACNLSTHMEGSSVNSSSSLMDKKTHEASLVSPQTPSSVTIQAGTKGNSERKTRRKSVGKETAKKGNRLKETTPVKQSGVEKSPASITPPATGHAIQLEELKPKESVECSVTKPSEGLPVPTSNLPDLNKSTSIFQQPFTDSQQVQLRAQILVYGSLISGAPPEEPHMVAAFGQSDGGRINWEASWRACVERFHGQKSQANNPDTPMQSRSELKDIGQRTPETGIRHGSVQSRVLSSPIGGTSNKGTPPMVSPMAPLSSPLWNITTPSCDGFPSNGMPRSTLLDYHQALSPLHPYQASPVQNFAGHNPSWLSQGIFPGQWVASSPISAFNVGARFSALPITEAVKLTPVKVSGAPGIKLTSSIPVVHSTGLNAFSGTPSLSDVKKATVSSGQASTESKSRKRKKVAASAAANHTPVPNQAQVASVTAPLVFHLPQAPTVGHSQISFLAQNQTDSVTAPVVSLFPTSVTTSTPASGTSKSSSAMFLSPASTHNHPRIGDQNMENVVISEDTLSKVEESKLQPELATGVETCQTPSDSKSRKRKKATGSPAVNQNSVSRQTLVSSTIAPMITHFPQVHRNESPSQIMSLAQSQMDSVTAPGVGSLFPTSVSVSTPVSIASKSSSGRFLSAVSPASTHDHPRTGYQNLEKVTISEDTFSKVEESKLQAEDAAVHAAAAVRHCQDVWSRLEREKGSGFVADDEAKLVSSAVSISAAASVAKVAAAAAKIASNVAEQARLMADEVFLSNRFESFDQSSMISHPSVVNQFDKATSSFILKSGDRSNHPNSIISAAREAARRRIEAASAASKHAENLEAIVKAAELAAEAVSQAGKIVAMGDPLPLKDLVESGPEGYWKTPRLTSDKQGEVVRHLNSTPKKKVEAASNVSDKEIQTLKHGSSQHDDSGDLAENQMVTAGISAPVTTREKDTRTPRAHKGPDFSKNMAVNPQSDMGSIHTSAVGQNMPQSTPGTWKEHSIKEGCLVEVYKDDGQYKGAWFAANVLSLKDGKAFVCYTEIQSDEGSEQLKEWLPLEVEGTEAPRIRIAHPLTTMRFEGTRKRRRTAVTDYAWSSGDRVDVWTQDCWREGVVTEANKIDLTALTVKFPAQRETSVVRTWNVRPSLIWMDGKWIEWSSLKGGRFSEGDTPQEKRMKLGNSSVNDKRKDKSLKNADPVEPERREESRLLPLSAQESSFNIGKSTRDENKLNTHRTVRSGLQKEGPRVIFGVPKPGKKQKFMDVSKHYVADGSNKNITSNDSTKFSRYLMPQAPGPRWRNSSRTDAREKQVAETKPRLKSRKPPIPSTRTLAQKDNDLISSKSTREAVPPVRTVRDSASDIENLSGHQNQMEFGTPSNTEDATKGSALTSSLAHPPEARKRTFTSNARSERLNKGKLAPAGGRAAKVEVKDKSTPEVAEPRRSNRRIQPTSRLLEGLQSSLTISKIPAVSHGSQRSHSKVTSKGNTNNG